MIILKRERYITNPGSKYRVTYDCVADRSGRINFRVSGKVDIREEINSYAGETDIEIISKMMEHGDFSKLRNPDDMFFGDFSCMPSIFEVQEAVKDAHEVFEGNKELQDKFGSFDAFVSSLLGDRLDFEKPEPDKSEDNVGE